MPAFTTSMKNDDKEWRDLCEQVAKETDHKKLMELAEKINTVLEAREQKLRPHRNDGSDSPDGRDSFE